LAILKLFSKEISKPGTNLSGSLASQIQIFCSNLAIPEEEFIRVGFKIQRFSKSDLAKIMVKLEMEVKVYIYICGYLIFKQRLYAMQINR